MTAERDHKFHVCCRSCGGAGYVYNSIYGTDGTVNESCHVCQGTGFVDLFLTEEEVNNLMK